MFGMKPSLSITVVIFGFCQVVPTHADNVSTKREIQAAYDKISKAYSDMDTDTILAAEADDYATVDFHGRVKPRSKDKERERLTKVWSVATSIRDKAKVEQVTIQGDGAVVLVHEDYVRTQTSPDESVTGIYHEVGSSRAYWIKTDAAWQLKQEHWLHKTKTFTINGVLTKKEVDGKKVR